jgi:hypothetical protein
VNESAHTSSAGPGEIVFLLKGYPRLSETFIAQEIRGLEEAGLKIRIVSLRHPTDRKTHPISAEIRAPVTYLPEYLWREPGRVLAGWWRARRLPGYGAALRAWLADLRRDPTSNRGRRFGQALVLAAELPAGIARLHAHFLHTPASVARYAALMTGKPWSVSAHAKDIWTTPDWEKREKLAACDWLVTCTAVGAIYLSSLAPAPAGDPGPPRPRPRPLPAPTAPRPPRDGCQSSIPSSSFHRAGGGEEGATTTFWPPSLLLPADLAWRCPCRRRPLLPDLKAQAESPGLAGRITWRGAARPRSRRSCAAPISSRWRAGPPATATATACPRADGAASQGQ